MLIVFYIVLGLTVLFWGLMLWTMRHPNKNASLELHLPTLVLGSAFGMFASYTIGMMLLGKWLL